MQAPLQQDTIQCLIELIEEILMFLIFLKSRFLLVPLNTPFLLIHVNI